MRPSYGAAVFGYYAVILKRAFIERSLSPMAVGLVALVVYGGLFRGPVPLCGQISFEGHLFGFVAGVVVAGVGRRQAEA